MEIDRSRARRSSAETCAAAPVSASSALPKAEAGDTTSSAFMPPRSRTRLRGPSRTAPPSEPGRDSKRSWAGRGSRAAATTTAVSTSSHPRRTSPAISTVSQSSAAASRSRRPTARLAASGKRRASPARAAVSIPARIFLALAGPNPGSAATLPSRQAASRPARDAMPSRSRRVPIFFGPRPGTRSRAAREAGNRERRSSR